MESIDTANTEPGTSADRKRFRSEIEFPYSDLESAIELARTVENKAGTSCETDELAAWMGQTATGGTFRTRLGAARMFGLIETGQGQVVLTQLGREVLDPEHERTAKVQAFLKVELFNAMYEQFKGNILPPPPAVERQMENLGVSPKQKERARQTFMKSAQYADFIDAATGRFVKPGIPHKIEGSTHQTHPEAKRDRGSEGTEALDLDPLLVALLKKIPPPEKGWPPQARVRWFRTFAMNVSQVYDEHGDPVEMKIELDE